MLYHSMGVVAGDPLAAAAGPLPIDVPTATAPPVVRPGAEAQFTCTACRGQCLLWGAGCGDSDQEKVLVRPAGTSG
jgi:hypothetical protein